MRHLLLIFLMAFSVGLGFAQANLEKGPDFPTDYIQANNPYYFGSVDGVLYACIGDEPLVLVRFPESDPRSSFTIPSTVTRIAKGAFKGCRNLEELIIPGNVHQIGENAFDGSGIVKFKVSGNDYNFNPSVADENAGQADGYYSLSGFRTVSPSKGVNIVVGEDGPRKVLVR